MHSDVPPYFIILPDKEGLRGIQLPERIQVKLRRFERRPFIRKLVVWIGKIPVMCFYTSEYKNKHDKINQSDGFGQNKV
jgi:hypothetical protein